MLHFLGIINFEGGTTEAAGLLAAGKRLGGEGFAPLISWQGAGCVLVARRRLLRDTDHAAIDPVQTHDGDLVLIGSGRIDRRDDLIAELGLDRRRVWTDAALMMAGFERWGEMAADRLRGDFSFAVWDRRNRALTLARDCFGTVPLFYHRGAGFVAFATNPAALLALGGVPDDLDPAVLGEYLTGNSVSPTATIYRAIQQVPHAATMAFAPDADPRTEIYWRPRRGPLLRLADDQAYVDATREVLADVVRGHLRSTGPIGVMLSGGFDSGALAATLALLAPEREIFGFTTVPVPGAQAFAQGAGREWEHVQSLARRHPNLRIQAVAEKNATPIDESWRDIFSDIGLPLPGMGLLARRLALAQAAQRRGVGTLICGDGGNRTLTGEGDDVFHYLFWAGRWRDLGREAIGTARYKKRPLPEVIWRDVLRDLVPRGALAAWRRLRGNGASPIYESSFLRREFAEASGLQDRWERSPRNRDRLKLAWSRDFEPLCLAGPSNAASPLTLLLNRMGLDCAAPLRDRRMVDFVLSLPPDQFRRHGLPRFLARRVLADRLPPETLAEPGYFKPFADAAEWMPLWWDKARRRLEGQSPADLAAAMIDLPHLRACLAAGPDSLPTGGPDVERFQWNVVRALQVNEFIRWHLRLND